MLCVIIGLVNAISLKIQKFANLIEFLNNNGMLFSCDENVYLTDSGNERI